MTERLRDEVTERLKRINEYGLRWFNKIASPFRLLMTVEVDDCADGVEVCCDGLE